MNSKALKRYIDRAVKKEIKNTFKDKIMSEESIKTASKWAGIDAELSYKTRTLCKRITDSLSHDIIHLINKGIHEINKAEDYASSARTKRSLVEASAKLQSAKKAMYASNIGGGETDVRRIRIASELVTGAALDMNSTLIATPEEFNFPSDSFSIRKAFGTLSKIKSLLAKYPKEDY